MGETREHLEQHGAAGMIYCGRAGAYRFNYCRDCVSFAGDCPPWEPDAPAPKETQLAAHEATHPCQSAGGRMLRYLDAIRAQCDLPKEHQTSLRLYVEVLRREIVQTEERMDVLEAERVQLLAVAGAMRLVDQISDQRRQIAHLQRQVEHLTGTYQDGLVKAMAGEDLKPGDLVAFKVEGQTGIAGAREDLERLREKGRAQTCECMHCTTARGALEGYRKTLLRDLPENPLLQSLKKTGDGECICEKEGDDINPDCRCCNERAGINYAKGEY